MTVRPSAPPMLGAGVVGAGAGPLASSVDDRWLMAYAAGLGETDPRYFDTLGEAGPEAHPLFPVCYEWPLAVELRGRVLGEAIAPLGVHARHRLVIHRTPRAGDRLSTTARVTGLEARAAGALVTVRFDTTDAAGRPVTTTDHASLYRGVEVNGQAPPAGLPPGSGPDVAPEAAPGEAGLPRWEADLEIAAALAHVYTECARIWNPIHTDVAVARAAGLPGPILHGTATLALAVSRVMARDLEGQPGRVAAVEARFTGMVPLPATLVVRGLGRTPDRIAFDVVDAAMRPVLSRGLITVGTDRPRGASSP